MLPIDLKGSVAIVTGSTQGIGLGIATVMAKAGCKVAGCGLSAAESSKAKNLVEQVQKNSTVAFYKQVDIRIESEMKAFVDDVVQYFGRIDFLISNAGANRFTSPENCDSAFWDENMDLNLKSHWSIAKACYPELRRNNGTIVFITSNHAYATLPDCFPYNVSKAGMVGLVKALAVQWGPDVRVVGIAPGFIQTEGGENWFGSFPDPDKKRKEVIDIHPVKKLGRAEDTGAFCAFLCSEYAGFINGTTYLFDGGRSAVLQDL